MVSESLRDGTSKDFCNKICQLQTPAVQQKTSLLITSPAVGSSIAGLLARVDHAPECKIDA
jgi:hypothetical protein